ncbi:MAG TPA: cobalamin-independent methionine synthase II family protein [Xanthobacteraceae bacterium]|jgi:5-methyltetrahydropteroyltriglutamate--homocysteine methyltransferase
MKRSSERILTTHVGSLPRPADLLDMVQARGEGKAVDEKAHAARLRAAVAEIVRKQIDLGIDIIDDGEFGKASFVSYVNERLGGFEIDKEMPRQSPWAGSREARAFPEFYGQGHVAARQNHMVCTAPITYRGMAQLKTDIDNLKAALNGAKPEEAFMPAISPASVADWQRNAYYKTEEEYLFAIADALREEYEAIVNAGLLLQVDDPHLVTYWIKEPDLTLDQFRKWAQLRVEALNHALRNIAPEKVRHHTCYGINMGPRIHDLEFKHIVDLILKIRAGAYSFEAANPRHEHEWKIWESTKLPAGKSLIPGVISHSTVLVEHPELVAERICRYANVVGRENVIAGSDCGFATFAGSKEVHPSIVWAKFTSLVEGARLASQQLWGGR